MRADRDYRLVVVLDGAVVLAFAPSRGVRGYSEAPILVNGSLQPLIHRPAAGHASAEIKIDGYLLMVYGKDQGAAAPDALIVAGGRVSC